MNNPPTEKSISHQCDHCDKLFGTKSDMKKHIKSVHNAKNLKKKEILELYRKSQLDNILLKVEIEHLTSDNDEQKQELKAKNVDFDMILLANKNLYEENQELKKQFASNHDGKRHNCGICEKPFAKDLNEHKISAYHKRDLTQRAKNFSGNEGSLLKILQNPAKTTYNCRECSFVAFSAENLSRHFKSVHLKSKQFKCTYCNAAFTRKKKLKAHIQKKHRN